MSSSENKIKCWLCGGWQDSKYIRDVMFNDAPEKVCVHCMLNIRKREDSMDLLLMELEEGDTDEEENPFREDTPATEGADKAHGAGGEGAEGQASEHAQRDTDHTVDIRSRADRELFGGD